MNTHLLTWKSSEWDYENLQRMLEEFNAGSKTQRWSCGTSRNIELGSRVFLMRQGTGEKGIFGSGYIVRTPYEDDHYNDAKREEGKKAIYVSVEFDELFDPYKEVKVGIDTLSNLHERVWSSQGSRKTIDTKVALQLEEIWKVSLGLVDLIDASEIPEPGKVTEGAKKKITVNAYARCRKARRLCIEKHGLNCAVCDFHFELYYGKLGTGFIHVHHLKPIAEIGEEYQLDPIADLRPVCANCHAMLHRNREICMSIEELRAELAVYKIDVRI